MLGTGARPLFMPRIATLCGGQHVHRRRWIARKVYLYIPRRLGAQKDIEAGVNEAAPDPQSATSPYNPLRACGFSAAPQGSAAYDTLRSLRSLRECSQSHLTITHRCRGLYWPVK